MTPARRKLLLSLTWDALALLGVVAVAVGLSGIDWRLCCITLGLAAIGIGVLGTITRNRANANRR